MPYQVAIGYNNQASLADVDPQPHSTGVFRARVNYSVAGDMIDDGVLRAYWRYSAIDESDMNFLITAFGLSGVRSNKVTIKTTDENRAFADYNATVINPLGYPENSRAQFEDGVYKNVLFEFLIDAKL